MRISLPNRRAIAGRDLAIATMIALTMAITFTLLSSGLSLIVTFVPGVVFAWLTYLWLHVSETKLPAGPEFLPLFFALLAVQFLHFAEEYSTGFRSEFPLLYGGTPYSADLFVAFNMASYFVFTVTCLLAFRGHRFLLLPALFFVVYGAIGNAVSHTWWSLYTRSYFPGLVTAQAYWLLGPLVLARLVGRRNVVLAIAGSFAVVLVLVLTIFASPRVVSS